MLTKNLLVFPTSRAIRDYISDKKQKNQLLNKSISIGDFFSKVIVPKDEKIFIDNDLRIILLQNGISDLDTSKLGIEKNFTKLFKSSEYLFKFFRELSQEKKSIDDIESYDIYQFYEEHLELLKKIQKNYIKELESYNYVDTITITNNYKINNHFLDSFDGIMFFYEGYFSQFEFQIIKEASTLTEVLLHVQINQFNTKNIELFAELGFELEVGNNYLLDISKQSIIETYKIANSIVNEAIYPVSSRLEQIAVVKNAITQMVKKNISPDKIAVILPDESFANYLKLFDHENYFNFAMGNDIYTSKFYRYVRYINEYLSNEEPKYKEKLIFEQIEMEFIEGIKNAWGDKISKEVFFSVYDRLIDFEQNTQLKEKLLELKINLDSLLFNQNLSLGTISLKDSFKILLQKINNITLDDVRSGKVTVIGILESRLANFDGVIIIDFNDDKIPKRSVKDKFFSTNVKEQVGLPSSKDRQNLQKYYYKRVIENAKECVITYVNNEENSMSRFVNELFIKPNIIKKDFSGVLHNNTLIKQKEQNIILDIDLSQKSWSASGLKNYLVCKRKYYLNNILKLKEHDISLEPKSYELGNIIHEVLEIVLKNNPIDYSYGDIRNIITSYQNENPYLTFELELWKKRLEKFYKNEQKQKVFGFISKEFEKPFNINYNGINLIGRIDRLDFDNKGKVSIYDYKTSKNLKVDSKKTYENTNDFQLEFYYLACRQYDVESVAYYDLYKGEIKKEIMLEEKLALLDKYLSELKTTQVSFDKCENISNCEYCSYKSICNR
jgi:RecB family exonuclease